MAALLFHSGLSSDTRTEAFEGDEYYASSSVYSLDESNSETSLTLEQTTEPIPGSSTAIPATVERQELSNPSKENVKNWLDSTENEWEEKRVKTRVLRVMNPDIDPLEEDTKKLFEILHQLQANHVRANRLYQSLRRAGQRRVSLEAIQEMEETLVEGLHTPPETDAGTAEIPEAMAEPNEDMIELECTQSQESFVILRRTCPWITKGGDAHACSHEDVIVEAPSEADLGRALGTEGHLSYMMLTSDIHPALRRCGGGEVRRGRFEGRGGFRKWERFRGWGQAAWRRFWNGRA